jgi:hypothetical protein
MEFQLGAFLLLLDNNFTMSNLPGTLCTLRSPINQLLKQHLAANLIQLWQEEHHLLDWQAEQLHERTVFEDHTDFTPGWL